MKRLTHSSPRRFILALAWGLMVPIATTHAQSDYNPLPEGLQFAAQAGFAFSTLSGVDPLGEQQFDRLRGTPFSLRLTHNIGGPLVGFVEGGASQRGALVRIAGQPDTEYRTRWWEVASGVTAVGKCISYVCPALDAGIGLSRVRQSILYNAQTGRPLTLVGIARYETSAVLGVRLAIPQLRGLAVVVRHHEGLTDLPTNGSKARSRSQQIALSLPLTR